MKVGFIGVGEMGYGILLNIVKAGIQVTAYDIDPGRLDAAVAAGAGRGASIADVASEADVVATMLPTEAVVEQVYLGAGGIVGALRPGALCADFSTIRPGMAVRLAEAAAARGNGFVDCPVSGGGPGARAGTLTIMAGGQREHVDRIRPMLDAAGSAVHHVGGPGAGAATKLANNVIAASSMVATAEAFQIASAFGVDPALLTRVLETSSGNTWVLHNMHPVPGVRPGSPSSNGYAPGFRTDLMVEMLDLICRTGVEKGIALTLPPALMQLWQLATNHGAAARDCTSVYAFIGPPGPSPR